MIIVRMMYQAKNFGKNQCKMKKEKEGCLNGKVYLYPGFFSGDGNFSRSVPDYEQKNFRDISGQ